MSSAATKTAETFGGVGGFKESSALKWIAHRSFEVLLTPLIQGLWFQEKTPSPKRFGDISGLLKEKKKKNIYPVVWVTSPTVIVLFYISGPNH